MLLTVKSVVLDIAQLRDPKVTATVVALIGELLAPIFGAHVGTVAPSVTGALVAVGVIVNYLEKKAATPVVKPAGK